MYNQHILFTHEMEAQMNATAHVVLAPPRAEPLHEVFVDAILEDASAHQRRSPFDWIASVGVHFAILGVLLIMPLYFTAGLDFQRSNLTFLAPPAMPPAPPPPPMASAAAVRPAHVAPVHVLRAGQLIAPTFIPKAVAMTAGEVAPPADESLMGVPGGVPGGIPGGQLGGVLGGVLGGIAKNAAPPAPVAAGPKVPVRVGGSVKPPRLIFAPEPEYPVLAMQARLSGVVVIEAVIDEQGQVKGMRVVSGHPLLVPAAMKAVAQRRYEPTVLDGEPTPIDLRVEIKFSVS